jgi:RNA 3'-terminal phosphate cyclase
MLVPYLAMAPGVSRIGVTRVTSHLKTIVWAVEQLLGVNMTLTGTSEKPGTLEVRGREISPK